MSERTVFWDYDLWPSREPYPWGEGRGHHPDDNIDFHVDLGCGTIPKGRIGVDRFPADYVAVVADLDPVRTFSVPTITGDFAPHPNPQGLAEVAWTAGLPFPNDSIEHMVSHHCLEHIGDLGPLMDEVWRVLKPDAKFRIIVPLFPSWSAVAEPDHKHFFVADETGCTFDHFCGTREHIWTQSFSVPYHHSRWRKTHQDYTARLEDPALWWTSHDARELRVTLEAVKDG